MSEDPGGAACVSAQIIPDQEKVEMSSWCREEGAARAETRQVVRGGFAKHIQEAKGTSAFSLISCSFLLNCVTILGITLWSAIITE